MIASVEVHERITVIKFLDFQHPADNEYVIA